MSTAFWIKDVLIAVGSTIAGTIVGWILGKVNLGRIHVSLSDYDEKYYYTDPEYVSFPEKRDYELYNAELSFKIRLYNSSAINKAIRNCVLEFFDGSHRLIMERSVKDERSRQQHPYGASYKQVEIFNTPAYESANIQAKVWIEDIDSMFQAKTIRFRYEDAKFHRHYIKYKAIDFEAVPRFKKDKENGGRHDG